MFESLPAFLAALKQTGPLIFLAILIATSVFLFTPDDLATTLGLADFRDQNRSILGATFVLSLSIVFVNAAHRAGGFVKAWHKKRRAGRVRRGYLDDLTPEERGYLAPYVQGDINTQKFLMDDGIALGLEAKSILYRPNSMFDLLEGAPFNIQPWAKKILKENPRLLDGAIPPTRF